MCVPRAMKMPTSEPECEIVRCTKAACLMKTACFIYHQ